MDTYVTGITIKTLREKKGLNKTNNFKAAKQELEKNKKRIAALDKLIQVAFEKNVLGTLRDDLFERMTANYEQEQRELIQAVAELNSGLPMPSRITSTYGHFFLSSANAPT